MVPTTPNSKWPNLPNDLLFKIANLSDNVIGILRLSAVCSQWRTTLHHRRCHRRSFPLRLPFPLTFNPDLNPARHGHFSLTQSFLLRISPLFPNPPSFLLKLQPSNPNWTKFSVIHPLNKGKPAPGVVPMADYRFYPVKKPRMDPALGVGFRRSVSMLDYRVEVIAVCYRMEFVEANPPGDEILYGLKEMYGMFVTKVVGIEGFVREGDVAVLALYDQRVALWVEGMEEWRDIDGGGFVDVLAWKGKFYAFDVDGRILIIDSTLTPCEIPAPSMYIRGVHKYLVPSEEELFVVVKITIPYSDDEREDEYLFNANWPIIMKVFKLGEGYQPWEPRVSLKKRAFFLGEDVNFSVWATEFDGCKEDHIYFVDDCFDSEDDSDDDSEDDSENESKEEDENTPLVCNGGVFNMEDKINRVVVLADSPEYAKPFWPFPAWLV